MDAYKTYSVKQLLQDNVYPGRGIILGRSLDGKKSVAVYFLTGRSINSRNRIFTKTDDGVKIFAFDPSKLVDPTLVIYSPVKKIGDKLIVTNGDQTDTIFDFLSAGKGFCEALSTRCFEPDSPNFTPRISGILKLKDTACKCNCDYKLSILKSADAVGSACNRFTFNYSATNGIGHFLHTYMGEGNPLPTFVGEPTRVCIPDDIDAFAEEIWQNLNYDNKISLFVCYTDLTDGTSDYRLFNKNV